MKNLTDRELLEELTKRLDANDRAYHDLMAMTKKLEELNSKLVESEGLKSSFLSNIRNEINNPLTSVLAMSEIIISGTEMPDYATLKSIVAMIHKEAFCLNFQLRNIFAAAELEAGEATPSFSNADLDSVLRDSIASYSQRASEKELKIFFTVSPTLKDAPFRTDAEKVQRIFSNLISNAVEYSSTGGAVRASAEREGDHLRLAVEDEGAGIAEADHRRIFERFKQLEAGATKKHMGHGLGLSIVKATTELLGGTVTVRSSLGAGARFTVLIPEADASAVSGVFSSDGTEFFEAEGERF